MFNIFKRNSSNVPYADLHNGQRIAPEPKKLPDIEEGIFIETANKPATSSAAHFTEQAPQAVKSDHNINLLYTFLDRNHEAKGYDDALMNPDSSHLQQNLDTLKNELARTINKVTTFYEDFIQETDYHILSRGRSGMLDMVEELEMKRNIAVAHISKVKEIENSLNQESGDCKGMLISYTRGFKNGLAAISHHQILIKKF
ncbi:hypothetical protein ACSBL2_15665 [Pedobacter sp. AW31-3R]|uniref:hypothetical protein n=1 Tax=Pedobacter sp. AW31-3R TaxID=3445781 RepID=UPI003F9FC029